MKMMKATLGKGVAVYSQVVYGPEEIKRWDMKVKPIPCSFRLGNSRDRSKELRMVSPPDDRWRSAFPYLDVNNLKLLEGEIDKSGWIFKEGIVYLIQINDIGVHPKRIKKVTFTPDKLVKALGISVDYLSMIDKYQFTIRATHSTLLLPDFILGDLEISHS